MGLYAPGGFQATFLKGYNIIHSFNLIPAKIKRKTDYQQGGEYWQDGTAAGFSYIDIELNFQGKSPRSFQLMKQGIVKEGVTVYSIYIEGSVSVDPKDRIVIDDASVDSKTHGTYKIVNVGGDGLIQGDFIFKVFDIILV